MKSLKPYLAAASVAVAAAVAAPHAGACTRVFYRGADSLFVIGRSLDWKTPIPTNIYIYPRGISKVSSDKPDHFTWTSRYGAVYAVSYDGGITEGMNEKGLVINGLFCKGTIYNAPETDEKRPQMSLAAFVAWMLDQCATTDEVVALLRENPFDIQGASFDGGTVAALHWGVTDISGKSVIFEFDHGKINIYDMGDYRAMTNDPVWTNMTAIMNYWQKIGGKNMLPGTVSSPDRCVRANYFAHHVKEVADTDLAVAICRSVLVNASVPYTYEIEGEPELSSTQWRTYSVPSALRYYFELVVNPGYYYVDLNKVDLRKGAPVLKLITADTASLVGDISDKLKPSSPFIPMY